MPDGKKREKRKAKRAAKRRLKEVAVPEPAEPAELQGVVLGGELLLHAISVAVRIGRKVVGGGVHAAHDQVIAADCGTGIRHSSDGSEYSSKDSDYDTDEMEEKDWGENNQYDDGEDDIETIEQKPVPMSVARVLEGGFPLF